MTVQLVSEAMYSYFKFYILVSDMHAINLHYWGGGQS